MRGGLAPTGLSVYRFSSPHIAALFCVLENASGGSNTTKTEPPPMETTHHTRTLNDLEING
ncbi:hypothetical protein [Desulfobulbus sp.]|uniref:hypothetical protein n=1 Tax=Desulfobulbus sp. TaxID=895 RepID=UPI00286FA90A|nr:hypothetical protein [Desulfobulbus sp.]